jgi:ParB/RepB/Spo0J family partition protein
MANAPATEVQKNGNPHQGVLIPEDDIKHIPLSDIYVDEDWNNRSITRTLSVTSVRPEDEGTGLDGLKVGIFHDGQDEPVIVRSTRSSPTAGGGFYKANVKQPYALVAGFRRFTAITKLNEDANLVKLRADEKKNVVPNTANGTIRAIVRSLSELEAIKLNLRENTQRDDMTPQDLVYGAFRLKFQHQMESIAIANTLGKHPTYINQLLRIASLPKEVLDHWRHGGEFKGVKSTKAVTVKDLDNLAKDIKEKEGQIAAYLNLLKEKVEDGVEGNQQYKAAKKRGIRTATMLGVLARKAYSETENKAFVTVNPNVAWVDMVELLIGKTKLDARQRRRIADAMEGAFAAALTPKDEEEEEEEEEQD